MSSLKIGKGKPMQNNKPNLSRYTSLVSAYSRQIPCGHAPPRKGVDDFQLMQSKDANGMFWDITLPSACPSDCALHKI